MRQAADRPASFPNSGSSGRPPAANIGLVATTLATMLDAGDVLFVASDEQRAEGVARVLRAAAGDEAVIHCPSSDALPGDQSPPSPSNVGRRVSALRALRTQLQTKGKRRHVALLTSAEAAARLYPPPAAFDQAPPILRPGTKLDIDAFVEAMIAIGYWADDRVDEPGEVAARGEVIDIFPADARGPARLDIAGGTISAIRAYDPISQRSIADLDTLEVGRAAEPEDAPTSSLFDHLPLARVLLDPDAEDRAARFVALIADAAKSGAHHLPRPFEPNDWHQAFAGRERLGLGETDAQAIPRFVERKAPLQAFLRFAKAHLEDGGHIIFAGAERDLRFLRRRIGKSLGEDIAAACDWRLARQQPPSRCCTLAMPIDRGWKADKMVVVAAADLIGSRALVDTAATAGLTPFADHSEIHVGDVVVHEDFGIGRVTGLEPLPARDGEIEGDAIALDYADGGRRLVAIDEADRIWRYGADPDAVSLDKLDGSSWQKRRIAIDQAIAESARGLAALAAERAAQTIAPIVADNGPYEQFVAGFPFTETLDQARAIAAVRDDLASQNPMDRLVVGDVGYGKTEVALRAAAMTALAGKQVAIAAPTTVLVRQHIETFRRRFAALGIQVAGLSRLSSAAEKKATKAGLADGSIRVVIGTAAISAKGVAYKDLGLVVIDEEQRFGTADKARLRALGTVNMLSLSATPIPRTLQAALIGLQQVSVIATPPARRQPIRTSVGVFDPPVVRTALLREKSRGGQSFIVVSRIEDMAPLRDRLKALVPELSCVEAHGEMPAADIDGVMVDFAGGEADVLLATNIIEAGLDVPRANTMIIWRADRFGLSQLHQLRGRVGRGGRRGQVLLLTDPEHPIAEATAKRLRTLEAFDRLGAGFAISARDLDIRGAGDLLGEAQAGHMKLIGVDLYQHLLGAALRSARGETVDRWTPDLQLGLRGALPADWIPDVDIRVALYGRLARIDTQDGLDAFAEELEDRFGPLPDQATLLADIAVIRLQARSLDLAEITSGPAAIALEPRPACRVRAGMADLVEKKGRFLLAEAIADPHARLRRVRALLDTLATTIDGDDT